MFTEPNEIDSVVRVTKPHPFNAEMKTDKTVTEIAVKTYHGWDTGVGTTRCISWELLVTDAVKVEVNTGWASI